MAEQANEEKKAERETDAKEQQKGSTTEDHTNTETSDSKKDSKKKASSVDDYEVVYEAELEPTALERSKNTTRKLRCIGILIVIMATILFIFSFPFSLFLVLFCFNTKRSLLPCWSMFESPWRLYLTRRHLHYHLPNPPRRPYINAFYCLRRAHEFAIPLKYVQSVSVQRREKETDSAEIFTMENIVIELKPECKGVEVPVASSIGLFSRRNPVHTLVIYSVKNAAEFLANVQHCLDDLNDSSS